MTDTHCPYCALQCAMRLTTDTDGRVAVVVDPQRDISRFLDAAAVEARTGYPIRSAWRSPGDPRPLPDPDAIVVAPATFNTINKWAAGISDTLALGVLCEAYGLGVPTAVLPAVNSSLAQHPAYVESLARLRGMGVRVSTRAPHTPKSGDTAAFPWEEALELLAPELSART